MRRCVICICLVLVFRASSDHIGELRGTQRDELSFDISARIVYFLAGTKFKFRMMRSLSHL